MADRLPSNGDSTPDGTPDRATDESFAMVVSASTPERPGSMPSALPPTVVVDVLTLCGACGGPAFFCGGDGVCPGGSEGLPDMVWMTKVRAVCVGTVLTQGSAAQFGGVLLRAALALRAGPPPRHRSELLWCRHRHHPLAPEAVALATEYLIEREVAPVSELSALLRAQGAPWLTDMARDATRAALLAPLARRGPDRLLALLCGVCGDGARGWEVLRDASEYDEAVRCPGCRSLHGHPLPRVPVGLPHPVSRCVGGAWGAPDKCAAHDGHPIDDEGLCPTGRAIYEQTWEAVQTIAAGTRDPLEVGVLRAMRRAQQWRAGRDFVRTVGTAMATVDVVRRPTGIAGVVAAVDTLATAAEAAAETVAGAGKKLVGAGRAIVRALPAGRRRRRRRGARPVGEEEALHGRLLRRREGWPRGARATGGRRREAEDVRGQRLRARRPRR